MKANLFVAAAISFFTSAGHAANFGDDVAFLNRHTDVIVLSDGSGAAKLAVVPAWQGRIMTSTAAGDTGSSYGWINRELIESGKILPHMNAFGGEDRFWMGPEGGQFALFFAKGVSFDFAHWATPAIFDTLPFKVSRRSSDRVVFETAFELANYSGTHFKVAVKRRITLVNAATVWRDLKISPVQGVSLVAFETDNQITNAGETRWNQATGLLSVWILGQFNPSPTTTIVVPIKSGPESELGRKVTSDYFGQVPPERLVVRDNAVFLAADGKYRSKIGINPRRSRGILGSYDSAQRVLTLVTFNQPVGVTDYVNSTWQLQDNPYGGDAANSYNDGPATPGAKPLGPFYELESSSPAADLAPGKTLTHLHRTIHLSGSPSALDGVARAALGVSLEEIQQAFKR